MKYRAGYKYQLAEPFSFAVPSHLADGFSAHGEWVSLVDCDLTFRAGYAWDGASGPTRDTPNTIVPSLVHDGLYQLMREGGMPSLLRDRADRILYDMVRERGMNSFRAWYWHRAVRIFADQKAKPGYGRQILEAS